MLNQKNLRRAGFAFLSVFSLFGVVVLIHANNLSTPDPLIKTENTVKNTTTFSSLYTDTTKQCKGDEPTFICQGYGGYRIVMGIGGVFAGLSVESTKSDYSLPVAEHQSVGWNPKVEWRTANGHPFAVIVRVDVNNEDATIPKKIGEKLVVKGLKGFEYINTSLDAKIPQANEKARKVADQSYTNGAGGKNSGVAAD